jgi:hypothetical protein
MFLGRDCRFLDDISATRAIQKTKPEYVPMGNGWLYNAKAKGMKHFLKYLVSRDRTDWLVVLVFPGDKHGVIYFRTMQCERGYIRSPFLASHRDGLKYPGIRLLVDFRLLR